MSELTLVVQPREESGKNKNRRLRAEGIVPAVVYGADRPTVAIQVNKKKVLDIFRKEEGGRNAIFLLELEGTGKSRHAMIRDIQIDPLSRKILHIDFQRVLMDQEVNVTVAVELVGTPIGVKTEGGFLDFMTREVEIECLPSKIPTQLEVDISGLHIGDHVEAEDLVLPEGVVLKDDPHRTIAAVEGRAAEEVEEEEGEELLAAEAEEPEVIGRSGDEEGEA